MAIKRNAAQCLNCGDIVESKFRHDFVTCQCYDENNPSHGIYVDGGKNYLRHGWCNADEFVDLSEVISDSEDNH